MLRKFFPVLFVFAACAVTPTVKSFFVAPGVMQYFLPPTDWTVENSKRIKARLDITYRTKVETPATVNLSFFNMGKDIQNVSSASLVGDGVDYPLTDMVFFFFNPETKELRISSSGDRYTLADVLEAENITLKAVVDGTEYLYKPSKDFFSLKDRFVAGIQH
jgi:hypothetical protein